MNPPEISTVNFYGKKNLSLSNVDGQPSTTRPSPGVMPYSPRSHLLGPTLVKKVFHKQSDALEFARQNGGGLMCFAFQPGAAEGTARLFLVAHPELFWHYDEQKPSEERCSFEVIPENTACKLYLDLEYDVSLNPGRDSSSMMNILKRVIIHYLTLLFGVNCDDSHIVDFDSSTDSKFSRHLIFDLTSACFLNNYHVGYFVKRIFSDISDRVTQGALIEALVLFSLQELSSLYVLNSKLNQTFFCDLCVYTKNRHFRLYRSTKRGKSAPLVISPTPSLPKSELEVFLSSLVTFVKDHLKLLDVPPFGEHSKQGVAQPSENTFVPATVGSNPFPIVDNFIVSLVKPGRIYRSGYFSSSNTLIYDIVGYRFCGNIGRQHKSNNIKYIVDLNGGVYYQKCHDPDCAHYRSVENRLPVDIAFQVSSNDFSDLTEEATDVIRLIEEAYESSENFGDQFDFTE